MAEQQITFKPVLKRATGTPFENLPTYENPVNNSGTGSGSSPVVFSGTLLYTLDNPSAYGTSAGDNFGTSVVASGDWVIVGAPHEDEAGASSSGAAYIFDATTGNLVHTLTNPNAYGTAYDDRFGTSVAISGDRAIVGASNEDEDSRGNAGKAYVFDVTTGALLHTLDNPNAYSTSTGDEFGYQVDISGDLAVVGAFLEDDVSGGSSGKVYVFNVTTGALLYTLDNPTPYGTGAGDQFGFSISLSGNYLVVGAPNEGDASGSRSGKAYVYDLTSGNLVHTLDNPNAYSTSFQDYFGYSVAISGNNIVVGAYDENEAAGNGSGKAYVFDLTTGNLLHTLDNPNAYSTPADDRFGWSVSASTNYAVVSAYLEDDASGGNSGKVYVFDVATGELAHTLDNPNGYGSSNDDRFGESVSVSDSVIVVGVRQEGDTGGTRSGKVYIFN